MTAGEGAIALAELRQDLQALSAPAWKAISAQRDFDLFYTDDSKTDPELEITITLRPGSALKVYVLSSIRVGVGMTEPNINASSDSNMAVDFEVSPVLDPKSATTITRRAALFQNSGFNNPNMPEVLTLSSTQIFSTSELNTDNAGVPHEYRVRLKIPYCSTVGKTTLDQGRLLLVEELLLGSLLQEQR